MRVILRCSWSVGSSSPNRPQDFHCPLPFTPRTAVLSPGFRTCKNVRVFPDDLSDAVLAYEPELIAAPAKVLRALAKTVRDGFLQIPSLRFALVAFAEIDGEFLAPADRDLLWDVFGVPVYEQLIGPRSETLAVECEAHRGLHVIDPACPTEHVATMLQARVETALCGCGRSGTRLVPKVVVPAPAVAPLVRAVAAGSGQAA